MPRTAQTNRSGARGRRRAAGAAAASRGIVDRITQLVVSNETLQRQNRELVEENSRLRSELVEIGTALGRLTGAPRPRRGRGAGDETPGEERPRRQRRPITDPAVLEKRRQALARARAARAERLAAARAARTAGEGQAESAG